MDDIEEPMDNNVTKLFSIVSDNPLINPEVKPPMSYYLQDIDGEEYVREGFMIFTSQHIAVMREQDDGSATPILVMPLTRLKIAELIEDDADLED